MINAKKPKKRKQSVPSAKVMKSKKTYNRKKEKKEVDLNDSVNIRSLLSKFVTDIFEKNYSEANSILKTVITEKIKNKVKTSIKKKKCDCGCEECEKNKKNIKKVTNKG
jgi:hypothetical protein